MNKQEKIVLARDFRKEPTKSEDLLWQALRDRQFMNLKFRRQYIFKGFILDFFCPELRLAIEIDGGIHHNQKEYDQNRQELLELHKIHFFRISSGQVEEHLEGVLDKLRKCIESICPHPHPFSHKQEKGAENFPRP